MQGFCLCVDNEEGYLEKKNPVLKLKKMSHVCHVWNTLYLIPSCVHFVFSLYARYEEEKEGSF